MPGAWPPGMEFFFFFFSATLDPVGPGATIKDVLLIPEMPVRAEKRPAKKIPAIG